VCVGCGYYPTKGIGGKEENEGEEDIKDGGGIRGGKRLRSEQRVRRFKN
jgi:hypothetical protein